MQNIPKIVCQKFREARRALKLTQCALANEIGCQQAALSMFEKGNCTKLSGEYVEKIAVRLGIDLKNLLANAKNGELSEGAAASLTGFCPDSECPSNTAYAVGSRTLYRITIQKGIYCAHCGEVLERCCPSCGAALNEGACCSMCGNPYVKD